MSASQIPDFRLQALTTCETPADTDCTRPFATQPDGSSIRLVNGLISPRPIIVTTRLNVMTWRTPILRDGL